MSKIIGYRTLTIKSEVSIPLLELTINQYLKDDWTLYGTTMNHFIGNMLVYTQALVKYSDSTEPRITKYRLMCSNTHKSASAFETSIINSIHNTWTFFGHTWYAIDSNGKNYYSQALVQYDSLFKYL